MKILTIILTLTLAATAADAAVQTKGSQQWPGHVMFDLHLIGGRLFFPQANVTPGTTAAYDMGVGFFGRLHTGKISVWLGGTFDWFPILSVRNRDCDITCAHELELAVYAMLTFEQLVPIPLVPWVRFGIGGDAFVPNGPFSTFGAFGLKVGAGFDYWLLRWLGIGMYMNFSFGAIFPPN